MDWNMITAISTAFMALVIVVTAIFALLRLREVIRSRAITAFVSLSQFLQEDATRKARDFLFKSSGRPLWEKFDTWKKEEIEAAEKVCSTFDVVGIMVSAKLLGKDLLMEWHYTIIKAYEAAAPMINEYRAPGGTDYRTKDYWNNFERVYKMAKKI